MGVGVDLITGEGAPNLDTKGNWRYLSLAERCDIRPCSIVRLYRMSMHDSIRNWLFRVVAALSMESSRLANIKRGKKKQCPGRI